MFKGATCVDVAVAAVTVVAAGFVVAAVPVVAAGFVVAVAVAAAGVDVPVDFAAGAGAVAHAVVFVVLADSLAGGDCTRPKQDTVITPKHKSTTSQHNSENY